VQQAAHQEHHGGGRGGMAAQLIEEEEREHVAAVKKGEFLGFETPPLESRPKALARLFIDVSCGQLDPATDRGSSRPSQAGCDARGWWCERGKRHLQLRSSCALVNVSF
jgi:hypothetical protein